MPDFSFPTFDAGPFAALPGRSNHAQRPRGETPPPAREAVLVCLADVAPRPRDWLWPRRLALGGLTLIAGAGDDVDELGYDLAARVSRGAGWPDQPDHSQAAGAVVLVSGDDLERAIRPRLDAAGAEAVRIVVMRAARCGGGTESAFERPVSLWRDLALVENAVAQTRECKLLVLSVPAAGPGGERPAPARELEELFAMLAALAARQRVAVVALVERQACQAAELQRLARRASAAVWLVVRDDVRPARRLLVPLGRQPGSSNDVLAFTLEHEVLAWEVGTALPPNEALLGGAGGRMARRERRAAAEWLLDVLAMGPLDSTALFQQAHGCGISGRTLRRAALELGLRPVKRSFDGPWMWRLEPTGGNARPMVNSRNDI
ncbi:MAG TPA: AAA family ATPase [Pirellulales bacterium]|jgi:hypothetical protein|nr:AAA family ATPase [Pirellulales bacterium]